MKALVYNPNYKTNSFLELIETNKPQLKDNNAIVKVTGVGVCGSDLLKLNQALVKPGTILGHEMVGIIDEISETMSQKYGFRKGDRILSSHHVPCLDCDYCLRGKESLCTKFKSTNFNPGAFCEYLELSEDHLKHTVHKIPDDMTDEVASFTEPVACCLKAAQGIGNREKGIGRTLIIGLGSIGLIMGQVMKQYCPKSEISGLDLLESRQELALELGFDKAISPTSLLPSPDSPEKYDVIFLCAGANATVDLASKHARNGATIVVFSSTPGETSFSNNDIYYKELTVMGSYSPNLENLREALELLSKGEIRVEKLITHSASLDELGTKIQLCNKETGIKTFLFASNN